MANFRTPKACFKCGFTAGDGWALGERRSAALRVVQRPLEMTGLVVARGGGGRLKSKVSKQTPFGREAQCQGTRHAKGKPVLRVLSMVQGKPEKRLRGLALKDLRHVRGGAEFRVLCLWPSLCADRSLAWTKDLEPQGLFFWLNGAKG